MPSPVHDLSWPWPGAQAGMAPHWAGSTSLGWQPGDCQLRAVCHSPGQVPAPKLAQDRGKETPHFPELQSAGEDWSGAAPGHKASYKVRQREAKVQALGAARLAGTWGLLCAAERAWQPWMPKDLSKVVGHAGRYKDQEWNGDLQCDSLSAAQAVTLTAGDPNIQVTFLLQKL